MILQNVVTREGKQDSEINPMNATKHVAACVKLDKCSIRNVRKEAEKAKRLQISTP
jgi:hypothetical protein